jgi:hypothetical protein
MVMQDAPTVMTDDEEAVQEAEGDRRYSKEVHGRDGIVPSLS